MLADALARSAARLAGRPHRRRDPYRRTDRRARHAGGRGDGQRRRASRRVVDAARRGGEAMWPMPLPAELRKGLDSTVADLANVARGSRDGGMLMAGLFLREFVPQGVRWAHLDIAGPACNEGDAIGYTPKGGTGAATRTWSRSRRTWRTGGSTTGAGQVGATRRRSEGAVRVPDSRPVRHRHSRRRQRRVRLRAARGRAGHARGADRDGTRSAAPACTGAASRPRRCCTRPRSPTTRRRPTTFGVRAGFEGIDMAGVNAYKDKVVDRLWKGLQGTITSRKIEVVAGRRPAGVADRGAGRRHGRIEGAHVVLATGSEARSLPGLAIDGERVITSDQALTLDRVPGSVVILGGGVIGVEFASVWRSFGAEVTIVEMLPHLLPPRTSPAPSCWSAPSGGAASPSSSGPGSSGVKESPTRRHRDPGERQDARRRAAARRRRPRPGVGRARLRGGRGRDGPRFRHRRRATAGPTSRRSPRSAT